MCVRETRFCSASRIFLLIGGGLPVFTIRGNGTLIGVEKEYECAGDDDCFACFVTCDYLV